jgi:hypothetical protein
MTQDDFGKALAVLETALDLLPDVLAFIEERKAREGMTTGEILAHAGTRLSDNELNLLADLARLNNQPPPGAETPTEGGQ